MNGLTVEMIAATIIGLISGAYKTRKTCQALC